MLQDKLKKDTAAAHVSLEQQMYVDQIMQRTLTPLFYRKLLAANYLIHQRYEHLIFEALDPIVAEKLDLPSRVKLDSLERDLEGQNMDRMDLQKIVPQGIQTMPGSAFALGAMYVLEGATLGGSVIVKQLKLNHNFPNDQQFYYYGCYGTELMAKWKVFLEVLNNLPEDAHQQALEGAQFMYREISALAQTMESLSV